jgi:tetratricopeptide (TPR) repeat protein
MRIAKTVFLSIFLPFLFLVPVSLGAPSEAIEKAKAHYEAGEFEEAVDLFREIMKDPPEDPAFFLLACAAFQRNGNFEEAALAASRAARSAPDNLEARLARAGALYGTGDFAAAAREHLKILKAHPDAAGSHYQLSRLALLKNRQETALSRVRKAIEIDPKAADYYYQLFRASIDRKEMVEALEMYLRSEPVDAKQKIENARVLAQFYRDHLESPLNALASAPDEIAVPIDLTTGQPLVRLVLPNKKRKDFVLDTASGSITVPESYGKGIPLEKGNDYRFRNVGIGGKSSFDQKIAVTPEFKIGDAVYRNAILGVGMAQDAYRGIFGTELLAPFLIVIDYPGKKMMLKLRKETAQRVNDAEAMEERDLIEALSLEPETASKGKKPSSVVIPFFRANGMILLEADLGDLKKVHLVLDTGAQTSMVSADFARRNRLVDAMRSLRLRPVLKLKGAAGKVENVSVTKFVELKVGGFSWASQRLLVLDLLQMSRLCETRVDGVIGSDILRDTRVTIDYDLCTLTVEKK